MTPVNQRSPPTPDRTPPASHAPALPPPPPRQLPSEYSSSRAESFTTAREDVSSDDSSDYAYHLSFRRPEPNILGWSSRTGYITDELLRKKAFFNDPRRVVSTPHDRTTAESLSRSRDTFDSRQSTPLQPYANGVRKLKAPVNLESSHKRTTSLPGPFQQDAKRFEERRSSDVSYASGGSPAREPDQLPNREWDTNIMRNVSTRRRRLPRADVQSAVQATDAHSPQMEQTIGGQSPREGALNLRKAKTLREGRPSTADSSRIMSSPGEQGLREKAPGAKDSPVTPEIDQFARQLGWSPEVTEMMASRSSEAGSKRHSTASTTSTVIGVVVLPLNNEPVRRRTIRHIRRNGDIRSVSDPLTVKNLAPSPSLPSFALHQARTPQSYAQRRIAKQESPSSALQPAFQDVSPPVRRHQTVQERVRRPLTYEPVVPDVLTNGYSMRVRPKHPLEIAEEERLAKASPTPSAASVARTIKAETATPTARLTPEPQHDVPTINGAENEVAEAKTEPPAPTPVSRDFAPMVVTPPQQYSTPPRQHITPPPQPQTPQTATPEFVTPVEDSPQRRLNHKRVSIPDRKPHEAPAEDAAELARKLLLDIPNEEYYRRNSGDRFSFRNDDPRRISFDRSTLRSEHSNARHAYAQSTPFSEISGTHDPMEVSEATAMTIMPHHNESVLVIQQPARSSKVPEMPPLPIMDYHPANEYTWNTEYVTPDEYMVTADYIPDREYESVPTLAQPEQPQVMVQPSTPEQQQLEDPVTVDSPLKNPRKPPQPPVLKVIPPTPNEELDRQLDSRGNPAQPLQRRQSLMQKARRYSDSFIQPLFSRTSLRRRAQTPPEEPPQRASENGNLHPLWRPRYADDDDDDFFGDMYYEPEEDEDDRLPPGGDTSDVESIEGFNKVMRKQRNFKVGQFRKIRTKFSERRREKRREKIRQSIGKRFMVEGGPLI